VSKFLRALLCVAAASFAPGCGLATTITLIATSGSSSRSSAAVAAPQVTSVTPNQASHGGGDVVTVRGENFPSDAAASIGGVSVTNVQFISSQELRLTVPPNPLVGVAPVVVTNPNGGSGTLSAGFTLTNQLPSATFGPLATPQAQNVVLSVTLVDPESDLIDLLLEVDTGNGVFLQIPSSQILSGALLGIASSPQGVEHKLTWDSRAILPSQDASAVRFRATPRDTSDQQDGSQATSTPFAVQNNTPITLELSQPGNDAFNVAVSYRIADPDPSDPVQIVSLTWTDVGSGQAGAMTLSGGQALGSVATSAGGTNFSSVWDSFTDLGFGNNRLVQVTVTVSDGTTNVAATSNAFFLSNGPISDQVVVPALLDVEGVGCGDVTGDGLPDLVLGSTNLVGGVDLAPGGSIGVITNQQQSFAGSVNTTPPTLGNGTNPPVQAAPAGSGGLRNYFLSNRPHPSEVAVIDVDGDGDLDVVAANSPHGPYVAGVDYLGNLTNVLANAGSDAGAAFANVIPHQVNLCALQASGSVNVAGGTWQSSQASVASSAPIHAGGATLATGGTLPLIGWFTQDLEAAELDASGSGSGPDLVTLHGVAQLVDALGGAGTPSSRPQRGAVVIRKQGGASQGLGGAYFLDPGPMGIAPVQVAVADITSGAHAGGFPNVGGPARAPAAGLPDVISVNGGDNSITIYVQTAPSGTPNATPGEFHGTHLPLSPLVGVLQSNPAFNLPAGDLRGVAIGDLNGDGANDFVICGQLSRLALVFIYDPGSGGPLSLNNNAGGPYATLTAGVLPFRLAGAITLPSIQVGRPSIGDITGDGRNDLVFPQRFANEIALYVNRGTAAPNGALGQSTATPLFGAAPGPTDSLPPNPSPVIFASAFQPFDTCIADFNADQRNDLLVAAGLSFDLSAFYQTTAGTLDNLIPVPAGGAPFLLAAGDLTGDGVPEIAATLQNANEVRVFSRNVTSSLSTLKAYDVDGATGVRNVPPYLVAPSFPFGLRIRELNQDGINDIVAAAEIMVQGQAVTTSNVAQPLNTTAGWFWSAGGATLGADIAAVRTSSIAPIAFSVDVGDVLGADGIPDVVVSHNQGNGLVFYRGLGGGNFAGDPSGPNRILPVAIGSGAECLIVDLNGDGVYPDVVQASAFEATGIRVRYGSAGGPDPMVGDFVTIPTTGVGAPVAIQIVDVGGPVGPGGEALPDIIFTGFTVKSAGILFQNTRAVLSNPPTFTGVKLTTGGEPSQIAVGDLNGDGLSDIAFPWGTDNTLAVYYRNPSATSINNTFFGPATFPTANSPIGCVIVDVDGDGRNDVVVSARGASALNVFLQR
jgi:IPT/TIG domain-containing protein/VCBS repeat protein